MTFTNPSQILCRVAARAVVIGTFTAAVSVGQTASAQEREIPGTIAVQAVGFNDIDQIVGGFIEPDGTARALRSDAGVVTILPDVPGSVVTQLVSINDAGDLLGGFLDQGNVSHSFFIDENGFRVIEVEDAPTPALDVNNVPQIVGFYLEDGRRRGFLREGNGTRTIDAGPNVDTTIVGNNDARQLVGAAEERPSAARARMAGFGSDETEMAETETIAE